MKRSNAIILSVSFFALAGAMFVAFGPALAANDAAGALSAMKTVAGKGGLSTNGDLMTTVGGIIKLVLQLTAVLLLIVVIYAGVKWGILAQGSSAEIKKAQDLLKNGVIGLIIVFAAYSITNWVVDAVTGATSNTGSRSGTPTASGGIPYDASTGYQIGNLAPK